MERLWAPWRGQYVKDAVSQQGSPEQPGCFLCEGLSLANDRENLIVWRRPHTVVVLNRYPYNNGHLLVAPRSHVASLVDLTTADLIEPIETIQVLIHALDRIFQPAGYSVGLNLGRAAGAGLPGHLHWHIVPRWDGDSNFMPVLGSTKVLIESLDAFYDRLIAELDLDRLSLPMQCP
jgi:ATP adenylyltransferase